MPDDAKSKIAELEKELYAKDFEPRRVEDLRHNRAPLAGGRAGAIPGGWGESDKDRTSLSADALREGETSARRHTLMKRFLGISVLFFIVASGAAWYVWSRGGNIISGDNITIDVSSPVAVGGGDPFEMSFAVSNGNNISLDDASLFIEFPSGFYAPADHTELPRFTKKIGTILAGQTITERIPVVAYGEENSQKQVTAVLEYRTAGSNATLKKTSVYAVKISSSPVAVSINVLREASTGQEVEMLITLRSNDQDATDGVVVEAAYPPDFIFKSADPSPARGDSVWIIASLAGREERVIKVVGVMEGKEGEEKTTKVTVGTEDPQEKLKIGVVYNSVTESTTITRSLFGIDVSFDGDRSAEHPVPFGDGIRADILWRNNSSVKITDAVIEVKLKGETLNRYSVYASNGGFYRSLDDTIVWEKTNNPALGVMDPGTQGGMSFSFSPTVTPVGSVKMIKNPQIVLEIAARARRPAAADESGEIVTFVSRKIKIETDIRLVSRGLYFTGPFENYGALPPRAEQETSYTIVWTVRNGSNNVSNATVKTVLPLYVKWLGNVSPQGEDVGYDANNATIVWNAGRIPAGGTREAAFQVSFTPSISQRSQSPALTGDSILSATDDFTKTTVGDRRSAVTTNITSDPQFSSRMGTVIE